MIRKLFLAALVAATAVLPLAASANFKSNYAAWREMSQGAQAAYVMGAIDREMNISPVADDGPIVAFGRGVRECLSRRLQVTSGMMVEAVTDAYRANPDLWGVAPIYMLQYAILKMCEGEVAPRVAAAGSAVLTADQLINALKDTEKERASLRSPEPQQPQPQQAVRRRS